MKRSTAGFLTGLSCFYLLTSWARADIFNGTRAPILPPAQISVIGMGTGDALMADGTLFNATSYNPALLTRAPGTVELLQLGLNASNDDISVATYLQNGISFDPGDLSQGYLSQNTSQVTSSLTSLDDIVGHLVNKALELGVGDDLAVKISPNLGIEVYESAHAVAELQPGTLLKELTNIPLPYVAGTSGAVTTVLQDSMQSAIDTVITPAQQSGTVATNINDLKNGNESVSTFIDNVGPALESEGVTLDSQTLQSLKNKIINNLSADMAYLNALAYSDTVAMATFAFNPLEDFPLTVGVSGKVVRRYYSWASLTLSTNSTSQLTDFKNDFEVGTTRWGVDLGLLYAFEEDWSLGISFQDLISSSATIPNAAVPGDILYGVTTDPAPTVTNIGLSWHPIPQFVLNGDVDDFFSTTSYYTGEDFFSHFKFGSALTLANFLQLRGGFSDNHFVGGAGLQLGFFGLDYSYAMEDLTDAYNHYVQIKMIF